MKNIIKLSILTLTFFILSCQKDRSHTQLSEINEVKISTTDSVFVIEQMEILNLETEIKNSLSSPFDYTYEWKAYKTNTPMDPNDDIVVILSTEKDLHTSIDLPPGDYHLQYTITDKSNNIKAFRRFPMTVTGAFYEGWLVSNNKDGKAQLSFIRKDGNIYYDPISSINDLNVNGKALKGYAAVIRALSQIVFFTDQEVYRINANDFVVNGYAEDIFINKPTIKDPVYSLTNLNMDQIILTDAGIYATTTPLWGAPSKYSDTFFGPDYSLYPYLMYGSRYNMVVYDKNNRRFLQAGYNTRTLENFVGLPKDASFDVNDTKMDMVAVDRGVNGEYAMLMKDNTKYYYCSFFTGRASPAGDIVEIENSIDFDKISSISASTQVKLFYYGIGNKVYVFDIIANKSRMIYEFPSDISIADVKLFKSKGWDTVNDPEANRRLVIAANKGDKGSVYYFNLSNTGDIEGNKIDQQFDGFGEIVHIDYRAANL